MDGVVTAARVGCFEKPLNGFWIAAQKLFAGLGFSAGVAGGGGVGGNAAVAEGGGAEPYVMAAGGSWGITFEPAIAGAGFAGARTAAAGGGGGAGGEGGGGAGATGGLSTGLWATAVPGATVLAGEADHGAVGISSAMAGTVGSDCGDMTTG